MNSVQKRRSGDGEAQATVEQYEQALAEHGRVRARVGSALQQGICGA